MTNIWNEDKQLHLFNIFKYFSRFYTIIYISFIIIGGIDRLLKINHVFLIYNYLFIQQCTNILCNYAILPKIVTANSNPWLLWDVSVIVTYLKETPPSMIAGYPPVPSPTKSVTC